MKLRFYERKPRLDKTSILNFAKIEPLFFIVASAVDSCCFCCSLSDEVVVESSAFWMKAVEALAVVELSPQVTRPHVCCCRASYQQTRMMVVLNGAKANE